MSPPNNALEVWLHSDLDPACRVGTLTHDRCQIRFHYDRGWLGDPRTFALDPDLSLDEHPFFPKPELGNFGIFLDSSPDRWGQTLMKRREVLQAKDEKRVARTLYAWDFLIGVQDFTRQGALRFRLTDTDVFLGNEKMAAPAGDHLARARSGGLCVTTVSCWERPDGGWHPPSTSIRISTRANTS